MKASVLDGQNIPQSSNDTRNDMATIMGNHFAKLYGLSLESKLSVWVEKERKIY